jgi:hypothetical protein
VEYEKLFLSLGSALTGAIIGYFIKVRSERTKKHHEERVKAYVDYIKSVAKSKFCKDVETLVSLTDAKCRIAIYGKANVVTKLSVFATTSMTLNNDQSINSFLEIVEQMRKEASDNVDMNDLYKFLFDSN